MPEPEKYNPARDSRTYMGELMSSLGYITPEQKQKADFLDGLGGQLQKSSQSGFKKPMYGHIANGEIGDLIKEYEAQKQAGLLSPDQIKDIETSFQKLHIDPQHPETAGLSVKDPKNPDRHLSPDELEADGGPIKNTLSVQRELRKELAESQGKLPDGVTFDDTVHGIADRLKIDYPAKAPDQQHAEIDRHYEGLLQASAESQLAGRSDGPRIADWRRDQRA